MKKILTLVSFVCFIFCTSLNAEENEFMEYDDFLFDVQDLLDKKIKVQVLLNTIDIPSRTITVDEHLEVSIKNIDRKKIKEIVSLCDFSDTTCWIDVNGELSENPNSYPTYLIDATSLGVWFLIGVAISETGTTYIGVNEDEAVKGLLEELYDGENYQSGWVWADGSGTLAFGFGSGVQDYFVDWAFNKDSEKAINEVLKLCNGHITGVLNIGVKCEPITYEIPW